MKKFVHLSIIITVCVSVLCIARYSHVLKAGLFGSPMEANKQAIRTDVQHTIREAETLRNEGKYAEAFRLLFDAMYTEERMQLALAREGDDEFSITAAREITKVERQLLHEDPSPLMQWFRDPDVPLEEKLAHLIELRNLAQKTVRNDEEVVFQGKYRGTLVQLMTSRLLDLGEKTDMLSEIRDRVQTEYTSPAQQEAIRKHIAYLRGRADRKFRVHGYVDAFLLIDEASQKARDIDLSGEEYINLLKQRARMETEFVHTDQSPLMRVFKGREMPTKEKQYLLYDLRKMVGDSSLSKMKTLVIQGKEYDGSLVEILIHPWIHWLTKDSILESIDVEILQEEPDYVPEVFLGLEDYLKKQENFQEENDSTENNME